MTGLLQVGLAILELVDVRLAPKFFLLVSLVFFNGWARVQHMFELTMGDEAPFDA